MADAAYKKKLTVSATSSGTFVEVKTDNPTINIGADMLETTRVGDTGNKTRIAGLRDWSVSCSLFADATDPAEIIILAALTGGSDIYIKYHPTGVVSAGWEGKGLVESFNHSGAVADVEKIEVSIQGNGALTAI